MIRNKKGFTLIELIMIIVVLGILAAVAIPRYVNTSAQAQRAVAQGAYGAVGGQLMVTFANYRFYPTAADFNASVLAAISRDGWSYQLGAVAGTTRPFNIWSGTSAVAADPHVNATYNSQFGSLNSVVY